ncbi:response regulator [Pseudoponticoccus marisrubri]|uniref:Two-component response regulator n=1 Tax=Pseudoponticoccus marisrubri TaxID=1685382 RepID=A0A0W7WJ01_9RHOB|nr:response regulator [Pseudoponticoccus marisrubri]KUF10588.1 two-component response regulator [Pseudoponticoccus marisrubri]
MNGTSRDLASKVGDNLPFLRRYARALTGSQVSGDNYAMAALEAILSDPHSYDDSLAPKTALFKVFHSIWSTSGAALADDEDGLRSKAQEHLAKLTTGTREALLLHTIEEFPYADIAHIMSVSSTEAKQLVDIAIDEMSRSLSGRVMIIEDETIIAVDLEGIVADMGHKITGVARTETAALELAEAEKPDMILSDIQLADNSSGIDAVNRILKTHGDLPVIFITAFPERLLTGEGPEPAFLISKPYSEDQVRSAVSQAMFFSSTETLRA